MNPAKLDQKLQSARKFVALKNYPEALALYAQLAKHFPQVGGEYGSAAALSGDYTLADTIWEKFLGHDRNNVEISFRLAAEYQNIGLHAQARRILVAAAKTAPRNLEAQLRLASFLARTSSLEEARAALAACLELNPGHEQVRYLSAHLDRRENKLAEAERQFRELLAAGVRNPALVYSCHSELAAIQDRTGNFAGAMARLMEAKALARQNFKFEAERKAFYEQHEQEVRKIISLPKNILTTWAGSFPPGERAPAAPVAFLSGSARSGTTLLEKILDAHPSVAAVDESPAFKVIQSQMDVAMPASAQKLNFWRQLYGNNLTRTLEENTAGKLFLDKNPSRTIWLPAFLRVFPELRVLIALRDPRDVMISLFFQDHPKTNYLTFEQLAQHYGNVMDVWLAVKEWEGLNFLETRYEDIIADLHQEGSRVTQFLGLAWHENQARFFEKNRDKPVMSTNYGDVTKPVYTRSVGRWQAYEEYLAPILPTLAPYCRKFGYA